MMIIPRYVENGLMKGIRIFSPKVFLQEVQLQCGGSVKNVVILEKNCSVGLLKRSLVKNDAKSSYSYLAKFLIRTNQCRNRKKEIPSSSEIQFKNSLVRLFIQPSSWSCLQEICFPITALAHADSQSIVELYWNPLSYLYL